MFHLSLFAILMAVFEMNNPNVGSKTAIFCPNVLSGWVCVREDCHFLAK